MGGKIILIYTLDSSALIAFLWQEPGADTVESILLSLDNECSVHVLNLCEVYYDLLRRTSPVETEKWLRKITNLVTVVYDMDFWQEAGKYKAALRRISLADCFCLTLAVKTGGTVVTSDHHEFNKVKDQGIASILFIR